MNRIYQGKVTNVEIANPDKHAPRILSASIPFSASDGEKVAKPDEVFPESGERAGVRCRNQNPWLPFDPDPKQAKAKWQSAILPPQCPDPHHDREAESRPENYALSRSAKSAMQPENRKGKS